MIARVFSSRVLCLLAFLACSVAGRAAGPHPSLPPPVIPECLGVNIHFTDPKPGELEMLAAAGFKWVRMDLGWGGTERRKGEYDFSAYDRLVAALDQHKLRAVFILDYGNPLYAEPGDRQPFTSRAGTEEFRAAYARWAAAAVTHFRNRGYLWELWNEPNHEGFWKPKPDAAQYAAVALAAAKAIRAAAPEEAIVGPATSTIDLPFLETCFQAGLLNYLDAVSVHPYRQQAPDTVVEEYRFLRLLMAKYQPKDRVIPIVSGEWGYSTAWKDFDDTKQARYLPRQFLTNIANDVALSIWYDWHDDGTNPKEAEHRFGIVGHEYHAGRDPVYDPKPAYQAMKTLVAQLSGYRFNKQLTFGFEQSLLLFAKEEDVRIAWWGKSRGPLGDWVPASPGKFSFTDALGQAMPPMVVTEKIEPKLKITIGEDVLYLKTETPNDLLRVAAAWERAPLELSVDPKTPRSLRDSFRNPLSRTLEIDVDNTGARKVAAGEKAEWDRPLAPSRQERVSWSRSLNVAGLGSLGQTTRLISNAPLKLVLFPSTSAALHLCIENPSGEAFVGKLRLSPFNPNDFKSIDALRMEVEIKIAAGKKEEIVSIPLQQLAKDYLGMDVVLDEGENRSVLSAMQVFRRIPLDTGDSAHVIAYAMSADGDAKVSSRQTLVEASPKELPAYIDDVSCYRVGYAFDPGWKFIFLTRSEIGWPDIPGQPKQLGFWLHGDGKGLTPRARFVDATGQVFQPDGPKLVWKGWRFVTFPMKPEAGKSLAHWGGAKDGVIHYPIRWDTPLLLDNTDRHAVEGEVYFSAPVLVY